MSDAASATPLYVALIVVAIPSTIVAVGKIVGEIYRVKTSDPRTDIQVDLEILRTINSEPELLPNFEDFRPFLEGYVAGRLMLFYNMSHDWPDEPAEIRRRPAPTSTATILLIAVLLTPVVLVVIFWLIGSGSR